MGAASIVVAWPETYTALERGVIDGICMPISPVVSAGWHEQFNYIVTPGFLMDNVSNIVNLDSWNQLPPHLQDLIIEVKLEQEQEYPAIHQVKVVDKNWKIMMDTGIQVIELAPADAEWMVETIYRVEWDALVEDLGELGRQLEEIYWK